MSNTKGHRVVLVLKTGGDFTFSDVVLLADHIGKYNSNIQITCFTDAVKKSFQLTGNLEMVPLPRAYHGWWSKMNLFASDLERLRPFVYMDLDTVVLGSIAKMFEHEDKFITLSDFYRPGKLASGVMHIPADKYEIQKVWENWQGKEQYVMRKFRGDQDYIGSQAMADAYWQDLDLQIESFKPRPNQWKVKLNGNEQVVCFHGKPRIREAVGVDWVNKYVKGEIKNGQDKRK